MYWIYVLQCEGGRIYVGMTRRLYRRWSEHQTGSGGLNTTVYPPEKLLGIYKAGSNESFINYRFHIETMRKFKRDTLNEWGQSEIKVYDVETLITERLMLEKGDDWRKVSGGKHVKFDKWVRPSNVVVDRPLCKCGLPSEVNYSSKHDYVYFTCPRSIIDYAWDDFYNGLDRDPACNFWEKYTKDEEPRRQHAIYWREKLSKRTPEQLRAIFDE
jgi:putative endonuclease